MGETLKRAISGAVYIIILLASILYSNKEHYESFFLIFGLFLLITVYEFCELVAINKILPLLLSCVLFFLNFKIISSSKNEIDFYSLKHNENIHDVALIMSIIVALKCICFLFDNKITQITTFSKYIYLIGYIILPFILISKIPFGSDGYNPLIIIGLFILIWTNDTFAYIVGKSIGKHKLFEIISPKKTIEGFFGGLFFTIFAGYLISMYLIKPSEQFSDKSILIWTIIAAIVGIIGTIGDLIESKFKRIAGVKDSGKIMPGHGGILDRLDSVIFVAPFIFLFYKILNYVS